MVKISRDNSMLAECESTRGSWGRLFGNAPVVPGAAATICLGAYEVAIASKMIEDPGLNGLDVVIPCIIGGWVAIGSAVIALLLRACAPEPFQWRGVIGLVLGALPMVLPSLLW